MLSLCEALKHVPSKKTQTHSYHHRTYPAVKEPISSSLKFDFQMVHRESNAGNFSQLCARSQRWPAVQLDCSDRFPQGSGKLLSSWKLLGEPVHTPHTHFVQDQYNTTWHSKLKQKFSDHSAPPNLNIKHSAEIL